MKRTTFALMAMAFAPTAAFAQKAPTVVEDANGYRPVGIAPAHRPHTPSNPTPRGPGAWQPLGPFGGDVADVAESPTVPNLMLAGVAPSGSIGGSLYRSTDGGVNWTKITVNSATPNLSVYDIEFAPDGTVWVGTDDSAYVSTDNGLTFTQRNFGIGLNDQTFAIELDPSNPDVIWAGVADALGFNPAIMLKSTDGGFVWNNVTPAGLTGFAAKDIAINPDNTDQVMVALGGAFGGGAVFYTADGGANWSDASFGLPTSYPANSVAHYGDGWLVGGGQLFGSQYFGLWQGNSDGTSWTQLHDESWARPVVNGIAVDPADSDTILVATADGVHKSTDAGETWTIGSGNTGAFSTTAIGFAPGSSSEVLIGASSFGVILSDDAVETTRISSVGIGALDVFSVAYNPNNLDELAVAFQGQNNGGVYTSTNGGATWSVAQGVPGTRYNLVKFAEDGTLYAISDGPTGLAQEGVYRRDSASSWTLLGPDQGTFFESELFSLDFGMADPNLFLASGADFGVAGNEATVWRTPDAGEVWTKVYEGTRDKPGNGGTVYDVHIIKDGTDQLVVAGMQSFSAIPTMSGILRSTDSGVSWGRVTSGLPKTLWGYDIEQDPENPNRIYVANGTFSGGGIWVSDDAGENWGPYVNQGINTRGIAVDPNNPDAVYFWAADATQVYLATSGGTAVTPMNEGLAGSYPHQIVAFPGDEPAMLLATSIGVYTLALEGGEPGCRPDFNQDDVLNSQDFFDFLTAFFDNEPSADYNEDKSVNSQDFFDFLNEFFTGC